MPFPELELGWNIAILIILGLLALYLLLFVAVISVVSSFRRMMKRDNKSVRVAMSAKLDLMKKFQEIIEKKKIKLSESCLHSLKYLDTEDFLDVQKDEFGQSRDELVAVELEIKSVVSDNKKLFNNSEIQLLDALLKDLNESLKTSVAMYNSDVLGYNYWIAFAPYKFFFYITGHRQKRVI